MKASRGHHLFVYYRVRPDVTAALVADLRGVQDRLAREFGVRARLMRKCGDDTLMEVYEEVGDVDALLARLDVLLAGVGFAACLLPGQGRHLERFQCV